MHANTVPGHQGPALLAKAGVTLAEAKWFYRQGRGDAAGCDPARLAAIRRKVSSFLAQ